MKVYLETLGCRLNEAEIESMARGFTTAGHQVVTQAAQADLCVINTCAVTSDASKSSRNRIRAIHRAQPGAQIVVTGCYSELASDQAQALPGVARVVANAAKDQLVPIVLIDQIATGSGQALRADAVRPDDAPTRRLAPIEPAEPMDAEPITLDYVPGAHGHTRAFVKVQDGCDNQCTFCVTRIARGPGRSRPIADIVAEIQAMAAAGYKEAVLTGVQIGSYGESLGLASAHNGLTALIRAILADTAMPRLRISSLEPWDLDDAFFALWADPRLCPHLHLPLQSGCDATLRRMRRRTDQGSYRALVALARAAIPDLALSTDVITGFPGETQDEFAESEAFIAEMGFMKLHVFPYSRREGTPAARMRGQVDPQTARARGERLRALSAVNERAFRSARLGSEAEVLWETVAGATPAGWVNTGLTRDYVRAYWTGPQALTNQITRVRLETLERDGVGVQVIG
jgi:threonylcarbamoyladenosine tRNA methylthiotransferase MtaB